MSSKESGLKLSVLDLAVVAQGRTIDNTFANSLDLARKAEQMGYRRYWLAEHHNMASVASSATAVLIGFIAGGTKSIRVGSGGIMLPNHAPLMVAEQFGTLASLYPSRIDLGLGRAPGTDPLTAMALRRDRVGVEKDFLHQIEELSTYFSPENSGGKVRAIPGEGVDVPLWILGSSTDSAFLAAHLGLPYAFASHFAPAHLLEALSIYRTNFRPSKVLAKPYTMACINVVAADDNAKATSLSTSFLQFFLGIVRNDRKPLQPPVKSMEGIWTPMEEAQASQMLYCSVIGGPEVVTRNINDFLRQTKVEELMITSHIYDHKERLRSYEIVADLFSSGMLNN